MIAKTTLLTLLVLVPSILRAGDSPAKSVETIVWPIVVDTSVEYHFDDSATASIEFIIDGLDGENLYCISCRNWRYSDTLPDLGFDFSGEFECQLKSLYTRDTYSTLFTENPRQDADWDSRARFFSYEVIRDCAEYPDFGRTRNFRLRGMEITLQMSDIILDTSYTLRDTAMVLDLELTSFSFDITVKSDASATTGITEPSVYAKPPVVNPGTNNETTCDCSRVGRK